MCIEYPNPPGKDGTQTLSSGLVRGKQDDQPEIGDKSGYSRSKCQGKICKVNLDPESTASRDIARERECSMHINVSLTVFMIVVKETIY